MDSSRADRETRGKCRSAFRRAWKAPLEVMPRAECITSRMDGFRLPLRASKSAVEADQPTDSRKIPTGVPAASNLGERTVLRVAGLWIRRTFQLPGRDASHGASSTRLHGTQVEER